MGEAWAQVSAQWFADEHGDLGPARLGDERVRHRFGRGRKDRDTEVVEAEALAIDRSAAEIGMTKARCPGA